FAQKETVLQEPFTILCSDVGGVQISHPPVALLSAALELFGKGTDGARGHGPSIRNRIDPFQRLVLLGDDMTEVTQLLGAISRGDPEAAADLLPLFYDGLRLLAAARLAAEPSGNPLQPTALVHEAYLRLVGTPDGEHWNHRGHFFAAAA